MSSPANSAEGAPAAVADLRVGRYANCIIHIWSGQVGPTQMEAVTTYTATACEAIPTGVAMIALVEAGAPTPSAEGRRALEAYYARFSDRIRALAFVAEGSGLWASMARSVMTAIQLMRKKSYPTKVLSECHEGIEWLAPHLALEGAPPGTDLKQSLARYIATLRATK